MKKILVSAALLVLTTTAFGQPKKSKVKGEAPAQAVNTAPTRLESRSVNEAYGTPKGGSFSIADPKVNFLNGRASGVIPDGTVERPVIGMPKLRYGVARGHLLFYNTGANTAGSFTGTGTVGTGTTLGSVGTSGRSMGVNGKNVYAGPGIYGNRVGVSGTPVNLPPTGGRQ